MGIDPGRLAWVSALVLLLLALLGWGGHWFFDNHRWETLEIQVGVSAEVRRNPWLAAERFLTRLDRTVESQSGRRLLLQPPAAEGVMVVKRLGRVLPPDREQALVDWIRTGGHLVLGAGDPADAGAAALRERFGVELGVVDWGESDADGGEDCGCLAHFHYPGFPEPLQAEFSPNRYLAGGDPAPDWRIDNPSGAQLLQIVVGRGRLTLLTGTEWLENESIGERDHALLLALLVGEAAAAWLVYGSDQPGVLTLIWAKAPYLVLAGLLLTGLLLWRSGRRCGPLLSAPPPVRRDLLEHLQAAAEYAWRLDRAHGLLGGSRQRLLQEWQRRHPALARLDRVERSAWIAERCGLAAAAVERALYGPIDNERELIRASAVLRLLMGRDAASGFNLLPSQQRTGPSADNPRRRHGRAT
jgi:hypothetical protein